MFNYPYVIELLSPKKSTEDQSEVLLDRFAQRYRRIIGAGCGVSIPDNPMGQLRLSALESFALRDLSVNSDKVVMNLNTFHKKTELDMLLQKAAEANLKYILVIRGDGGPQLPKLEAKSIGGKRSVATSIDLISYINKEYAEQFITGAAFNPYNPMPFELDRMKQKIDAGAKYAVTQPVIGKDKSVDMLKDLDITIVVEAWMSENIDLLYRSVGKQMDEKAEKYDPVENLKALHEFYPQCSVYLSMLSLAGLAKNITQAWN